MAADVSSIVINVEITDSKGKKSRLQVDVDEELMAAVQQLARLRGVKQGDVVNAALMKFFTAPLGDEQFAIRKRK